MLQSTCTNCSSRVYQFICIHGSRPQRMRFQSANVDSAAKKNPQPLHRGLSSDGYLLCFPSSMLTTIWQNQILCCPSKRKHQVLLQKAAQRLLLCTMELQENRSWQSRHRPIPAPPCWVFATEQSTNNSETLRELGSAQPLSGQQKTSCPDLLIIWHPMVVAVATVCNPTTTVSRVPA